MGLSETALRAIESYGGPGLWEKSKAVETTLSAGGLAFRLKWQRPFNYVQCRFEIGAPRATIRPIDREGNTGILEGHDARIENKAGEVIEVRRSARQYFPYGRRAFWWDRLDQTYFAGYALWNYMLLPALLMRPDIEWKEEQPGILEARFPPHIPTHSERQTFHFDPATGLLRQMDYTADVMGGWAKAAMVVREHAAWNGITYWSHRQGTPRQANGLARRSPVLVDIRVHDWRIA